MQLAVGVTLLSTVFGIPFAMACAKIYAKDNAVKNEEKHRKELAVMHTEWLGLKGHVDRVNNDIGALCETIDSIRSTPEIFAEQCSCGDK